MTAFGQDADLDQLANLVNFAINSPLVWDVFGSKRNVFGIPPLLQGQMAEASTCRSSARIETNSNEIRRQQL